MKLTSPYGTAWSTTVESLRSGFPVSPERVSVKFYMTDAGLTELGEVLKKHNGWPKL